MGRKKVRHYRPKEFEEEKFEGVFREHRNEVIGNLLERMLTLQGQHLRGDRVTAIGHELERRDDHRCAVERKELQVLLQRDHAARLRHGVNVEIGVRTELEHVGLRRVFLRRNNDGLADEDIVVVTYVCERIGVVWVFR